VNPIFASLIKHKAKRKPGNGATQPKIRKKEASQSILHGDFLSFSSFSSSFRTGRHTIAFDQVAKFVYTVIGTKVVGLSGEKVAGSHPQETRN